MMGPKTRVPAPPPAVDGEPPNRDATRLLATSMPIEYGGVSGSFSDLSLLLQELAQAGFDAPELFTLSAQLIAVQHTLLHFGTSEQKATFLPRLISGAIRGAHAVTEPASGADVIQSTTSAYRTETGYIINGKKTFVTGAAHADVGIVLAKTTPQAGVWGLSAFIVDLAAPGAIRRSLSEQPDQIAGTLGELSFSDYAVSSAQMLGREGMGWAIFTRALSLERALLVAPLVGFMKRQLSELIKATNEKACRGRPVARHQAISHRISDMAIRHHTAALLLADSAQRADADALDTLSSCATKIVITEMSIQTALDAIRVTGASSCLESSQRYRELHDSLSGLFYSGPNDVLRTLIARSVGLSHAE